MYLLTYIADCNEKRREC